MGSLSLNPSYGSAIATPYRSTITAKQGVLSLIDARGEICRAALVGVQFLDEGTVRATDFFIAGSWLDAEDLIRFLLRHFATACRSRAGAATFVMLRLFTPAGRHAIKIGRQQITASVVDFAQQFYQGRSVQCVKRSTLIAASKHAATHGAGVMIEFHFEIGGPHMRHLAGASLCSRRERRGPKRCPAEQPQTKCAERDRSCNGTPKQQKAGQQQRRDAAHPTQRTRDLLWIGFRERADGPQHQQKGHSPKQKCRHGYFSCSISLVMCAPRVLRSV